MTASTTPLADKVSAELSGLLSLGFSDHQAKTLIVSAYILVSNESKKPAPQPEPPRSTVALIDCDDDAWVLVEGETDLWHCPAEAWVESATREDLETRFGPLKEVTV